MSKIWASGRKVKNGFIRKTFWHGRKRIYSIVTAPGEYFIFEPKWIDDRLVFFSVRDDTCYMTVRTGDAEREVTRLWKPKELKKEKK